MTCWKKVITFLIIIILENYLLIQVLCFVDFNSVPKNLSFISVNSKRVKAKTNYKLTWINFTANDNSAQLFVSLPPKLRVRQKAGEETRLTIGVSGGNATLRIREISGMHTGLYSAFRVVNESNLYQRRDFYIAVTDLGRESALCNEDSACQSNHCIKNKCVCDKGKPVPLNHNCYAAQPIGNTCFYSKQCRFIAGNNSECDQTGRCRCDKNSFAIFIPFYGKYCIEPKGFGENCTYSEECEAIGANRYCNEEYKCECIPGYTYKTGIGCRNTANKISSIHLTSSLSVLFILTLSANNFL